MAIELVIKISEEDYETLVNVNDSRLPSMIARNNLFNAIATSVPLPKGHGRLGDLSKVYDKLNEVQIEGTEEYKGLGEAKQIICDAPTIVEAEKGN